MNNSRVAILLSTYNGAKYLKDQLNSIINQSYSDWQLYIRDDGSSDETIEILSQYAKKDDRIILLNDNLGNIGSVKSYFYLLEQVESEFYMFADQDDFWKRTKIEKSMVFLNQKNNNRQVPVCIYTNLQIVNDALKGNNLLLSKNWQDFPKLLFTNNLYGCTMLFNRCLKEQIKFDKLDYKNIYVHDWWLALVCSIFGKIYYLNESTILYRQHHGNQIGASAKGVTSILKRLFNKTKDEKSLHSTVLFANELIKSYGNDFADRKILGYVKNYAALTKKSNILNNLKIVLKYPPQSVHLTKELFYSYILIFYSHMFLLK